LKEKPQKKEGKGFWNQGKLPFLLNFFLFPKEDFGGILGRFGLKKGKF